MMARYCAQSDADTARIIIHEPGCGRFDLASLLAQGRLSDLGEHEDVAAVLRTLPKRTPDAAICRHCCPHGAVEQGNPRLLPVALFAPLSRACTL